MIILANSGAGKTTFVAGHPELGVVDGDDVIGRAIGWPPSTGGLPWHVTMSSNELLRRNHLQFDALSAHLVAHPKDIILVHLDTRAITDASLVFGVVLLDPLTLAHRKRARARHARDQRYTATQAALDTGRYTAWATAHGHVQTFASFLRAVHAARASIGH